MTRFEQDVRDMLQRRANDVEGAPACAVGRSVRPPRGRRLAAAAIVLAVVGVSTVVAFDRTSDNGDVSTEPVTDSTVSSTSAAVPPTSMAAADGRADEGLDPGPIPAPPADWRALLPVGFVPETAVAIHRVEGTDWTAAEAVQDLLWDRAPLLNRVQDSGRGLTVSLLEQTPTLDVLRLAAPIDGHWMTFLAVVRPLEYGHEVVAVLSEEVDVTGVRRTADGIAGTIVNETDQAFAIDILDSSRTPVPGSPAPAGLTGTDPVFGTAGSGPEVAVPLDPADLAPVIVQARHVGGDFLSITEFALRPPTMAGMCSGRSAPALNIELGEWFEQWMDGPAPETPWPSIDGQTRNHALGDYGTIEVLWPPSPEWLEFIDRWGSTDPPGEPGTLSRNFRGLSDLALGTGGDPCEWIQIGLSGDPTVVGRLADAIGGMFGFGLPLDLGEFSPDDVLSEPDPVDPNATAYGEGELVESVLVAQDLPSVPENRSCDGLPDAPPHRGDGGHTGPTPVAALESLLAAQPLDGMLPSIGYQEVAHDTTTLGFVAIGDDFPVVVVSVSPAAGAWVVDWWEAAAC